MAKSDILVPFIRSWEGGWSDSPFDAGGATMCGITMTTFTAYRTNHGQPVPTKADLRAISDNEWHDIFRELYWNRLCADQINSQPVANMAVDWLWHSGPVAIRVLQCLCGTTADGIVGPMTIHAVNHCRSEWLFSRLKEERMAFLEKCAVSIPSNKRYLTGWMRRVNSITFDSLELNK